MIAEEFHEAFAARLGVPAPTATELATMLGVAAPAADMSERVAASLARPPAGASGMPAADLLSAARRVADHAGGD